VAALHCSSTARHGVRHRNAPRYGIRLTSRPEKNENVQNGVRDSFPARDSPPAPQRVPSASASLPAAKWLCVLEQRCARAMSIVMAAGSTPGASSVASCESSSDDSSVCPMSRPIRSATARPRAAAAVAKAGLPCRYRRRWAPAWVPARTTATTLSPKRPSPPRRMTTNRC